MNDNEGTPPSKKKKEYSFGEYDVVDFEAQISSYSMGLDNLAIYARIPGPPADCIHNSPADFCSAPP